MSTAEMGFIDNKLLQLSVSLIRFMDCRGMVQKKTSLIRGWCHIRIADLPT